MARPPCPSPTVRWGTHLRVGGRRTEAHEVRPTRTVPRDLRSLPATQPRTGCPAGIRGDESGVASESLGGNRDREGLRPSRRFASRGDLRQPYPSPAGIPRRPGGERVRTRGRDGDHVDALSLRGCAHPPRGGFRPSLREDAGHGLAGPGNDAPAGPRGPRAISVTT